MTDVTPTTDATDSLFEIVDDHNSQIVALKTTSKMLRLNFEQALSTAERILGGRVRPFPLELTSQTWVLITLSQPKLFGDKSLHDEKGHLIAASQGYLNRKGENLSSAIGKSSYNQVLPRDLQRVKQSHKEVLNGNETKFTFKALCKGNSRRDNTCRAIPINNPSGTAPYSLILHGVP